MPTKESLNAIAANLVSDLVSSCHPKFGFSSMTCAAYDTAWISMIAKPPGTANWLFPSSFLSLLHMQNKELGGWTNSADTQTDVILNTAAGLLALSKHRNTCIDQHTRDDLDIRISAATDFLLDRLHNFEPSALKSPLPVGFELLLPTLLGLLSEEEELQFSYITFPGLETLLRIRDDKLSRMDLKDTLDTRKLTTALHSLEAFIGRIDFDCLKAQKTGGSMMGSPSSTAAYMMHSSVWDDECEEYLRHVLANGSGKGSGAAPSAFPSTYFEISWVISTLLANGFSRNDLGPNNLEELEGILRYAFREGGGRIGFACGIEADADDTAKGLIAINLLGLSTPAESLVNEYNTGTHFSTYPNERDASVTTTSNALAALCICPDMSEHTDEITTSVRFLTQRWWKGHGDVTDKWNISPLYPMMLMVQALMRVVGLTVHGAPLQLASGLAEDILIVLLQAMMRLLQSQNENGSWDDKRETTAYALIALKTLSSLPLVLYVEAVTLQVENAIIRGRDYLAGLSLDLSILSPELLWTEKVSYGSSYLSQSYILAALTQVEETEWLTEISTDEHILTFLPEPIKDILKPAGFFQTLGVFSKVPRWVVYSSLVEACLFRRRLRNECAKTFPHKTSNKEKHLAFIPFTWIAINNIRFQPLGSDIMLEMMTVSALAHQVDEFIETHASLLSADDLSALKISIPNLVTEAMPSADEYIVWQETLDAGTLLNHQLHQCEHCGVTCGNKPPKRYLPIEHGRNCHEELNCTVQHTIQQFISYMCRAFSACHATVYIRTQLKDSLADYIVAHLSQTEANRRLATQKPEVGEEFKTFHQAGQSLLRWTRTTSGDQTVGRLATWLFFSLLGSTGGRQRDPLPSPRSKYVAEDVARHLAASCRLYNDIGSMARDGDKDNLNSINFPEFSGLKALAPGGELMHIADYERRCLDCAMEELKGHIDGKDYEALATFCSTADMYSEMYVVQDMTPHIKLGKPAENERLVGAES